jgi:phage terminase large subunit-like protein
MAFYSQDDAAGRPGNDGTLVVGPSTVMSFGLRLGRHPQVFISTTPKPIPLLKRLINDLRADEGHDSTTTRRTSPHCSSRRRSAVTRARALAARN